MSDFVVGDFYTRDQVGDRIRMPVSRRGGAWDTGYDEWDGEAFIFANVGVAGRTGHDYGNRWEGKQLIWFGKTRARRGQPQVDRLISNSIPVHMFWRGQDRSPFTYAGVGQAVAATADTPVQVVWAFDPTTDAVVSEPAHVAPEPRWRRGPPPVAGPVVVVRHEGETDVYLMRLEGPVSAIVDVPEGHHVIKIGISGDVERRVAELNMGFPPGCRVWWGVVRTRKLGSGIEAFSLESRCLEDLRGAGYWTGGEFAVVPEPVFEGLLR